MGVNAIAIKADPDLTSVVAIDRHSKWGAFGLDGIDFQTLGC